MSEREREPAPLGEPETSVGTTETSAAAVALALVRGRTGARPGENLDAFLEEQTRFLRLQSERLHERRAKFEMAAGMDLSRPDRAALDVFLDRTVRGPLHG